MSKVIDNIEDIASIDAKANLASPTLTGTPTVPTPTANDNSTRIATTEFVNTEISNDVGVANSDLVKTALNASGTAPIYACRAWVNFNGTGTVAIRASGNVSSITDNGVGDYTVNFTTAIQDDSYVVNSSCAESSSAGDFSSFVFGVKLSGNATTNPQLKSTTQVCMQSRYQNQNATANIDLTDYSVSIFR